MSSRIWCRSVATALAGAVVFGGLAPGVSVPAARAQPAEPTTENRRPMSPDQVLMMISDQYETGRGGGQVSKLIGQVITLRKRGVRPSRASTQALVAALDRRPNQKPLVDALQATLSDQRRQFSRQGIQAPGGAPPVATPGSPQAPLGGPAWGPDNPMQQDSPVFQSPGR